MGVRLRRLFSRARVDRRSVQDSVCGAAATGAINRYPRRGTVSTYCGVPALSFNASRTRFTGFIQGLIEVDECIAPDLLLQLLTGDDLTWPLASIDKTRKGCSCSRIGTPCLRNSMASRSSSYTPKRILPHIRYTFAAYSTVNRARPVMGS